MLKRLLTSVLLCGGALAATGAAADRLTVFAAASLKEALEDVAGLYEAATGNEVVLSFAGSSILARQIAFGAPADVFISANEAWMDDLETRGLIAPDTRLRLLANRLVMVAPQGTPAFELSPQTDLTAMLGEGRLAMALVQAVPAGIYGKAALDHFGLWQGVAARVAQTDNVRAALALVARGEAPLGIVYASDVGVSDDVSVVARFPENSHPAILYPAAAIKGSNTGAAGAFLTYLQGDAAQAVFKGYGFAIPEGKTDG
ncbi:molybdate ABC transporter substrate-binding protein [Shimia sp. SDUM112013]|uniref:molybdate ABC transporter substrate-binding protein n=1 Tax=Shimia sp. SDUM112013 TaxID=3136160 RepID=UPI0032EB5D8D